MAADSKRRVEEIFDAALEREGGAEREAYLDGACGPDAELRARVDSLLAAHEEAGAFLQSPAVGAPPEEPGARIGPYKLLQLIGEGGMGAVYMAEQVEPVRRKVALKIIKLGMDTKQVIARFEAERQALALTDHANIARVLDAGATETGRPYFVMELVKGIPIHDYCDKNNLSTRERLRLFLPVCSAVQHAHQRGIIHRDLKPGNILVTLHDGEPVPKVIDFGIAKATNQRLTEKTLFTEFRQLVGTPEYMSPEQAEMSGLDVDTRTDIYALGVLLYQLLTGTTPFDPKTLREGGYAEFQRIIREQDPEPLSTRIDTMGEAAEEIARHRRAEPAALTRLFRGDLDWIVMKALEKDRTRRYATASDLAADVRRHLEREPVLAGPPSAVYKLRKFVQRNRVPVLAGTLALTALLIGLALAVFGLMRARSEAVRSQEIADHLQDVLASTDPERALGLDTDVEETIRAARRVFGDDHATVAALLSTRALQLQSVGDLDAAEPLCREALSIWRRLYGDEDLNVGVALSRLGTLLRLKGDHTAAEEAYRESLAITAGLPDEGGVARSATLFEYAAMLLNRREAARAAEMLRESIRLRRQYAAHQKLQIAVLVNAYANALVFAGKPEEMEPAVRETLAAWRGALPGDSPLLAKVLSQIGFFFLDRGDREEGEPLLREAVTILGNSPEPPIVDLRTAYVGMGRILGDREFLDYAESTIGHRPALHGHVIGSYAGLLDKSGHPARALEMDLLALDILVEDGSDAKRIRAEYGALRDIAWRVAVRPGRPAAEYETALRAARKYLDWNPEEFAVVNTEGVALYRLGRYAEALATLARSDAHFTEHRDGGIPEDVAVIAMAHHRLGREAEAAAALDRLRALMEKEENKEHADRRALLEEATGLIEPE
jgi:serine/threonine protein kinase/tetratricopeptide (TPR) repeat protein